MDYYYFKDYKVTSNLKSIYENQYNEYDCDDYNYNLEINEYDIDTPIGWSFICFDETISFYKNCNSKTSNRSFIE